MKKWIAWILTLICILSLVSCGSPSMNQIIKSKPCVTGVVTEVGNGYAIIHADDAPGYPNGSDWQISLTPENADSYTAVTVGDEIVVYHDGNVMESDPLRVGKVYAITLKTPADRVPNENP